MRLCEEYFKRHSINDVPVAYHCSAGSLILRTTDPSIWKSRWILISIAWENHDFHPGKYKIGFNLPIHDGYLDKLLFTQFPPTIKKWHEYEDFFIDWSANLEAVVPVVGLEEVFLAAWEMFVFSYDSWFNERPDEIKRLLFDSLDKENTIHQRYQYCQHILTYLSTSHPETLKVWKYNVLVRVQNYSDWLAKIINN